MTFDLKYDDFLTSAIGIFQLHLQESRKNSINSYTISSTFYEPVGWWRKKQYRLGMRRQQIVEISDDRYDRLTFRFLNPVFGKPIVLKE